MRQAMKRHGAVGLLVGVTLWSLSGCRAVGSALGNRDAELRTGQWWAGPLPDLSPPKPHERVAWVAYTNVTQEDGYALGEALRQGLRTQGYTLTEDPDQAHVQVFYTLRFAGENGSADAGRSTAAALGGLTGAAGGALLAKGAGGSTPVVLGGGLAGALVGGLAGTAIANYSQVIEYNLMLDVRMAQRKKALVTRTTLGSQRDQQRSAPGGRTGGGGVGGTRGTTLDTQQQLQEADHLLWHANRLVLWARQIRLQPEEARPALAQALVRTLPQLVP